MNRGFFGVDGWVHQAEKQGRKQKYIRDVSKKNKMKDVCLYCEKEKCNGHCEHFKRKR